MFKPAALLMLQSYFSSSCTSLYDVSFLFFFSHRMEEIWPCWQIVFYMRWHSNSGRHPNMVLSYSANDNLEGYKLTFANALLTREKISAKLALEWHVFWNLLILNEFEELFSFRFVCVSFFCLFVLVTFSFSFILCLYFGVYG